MSENFFWASGSGEHSVTQWDQQFMAVDTHRLPPGVFPAFGIGDSGEMICIAEYNNGIRQSMVAYKGPEESFDFELHQDIAVTSVKVLDDVFAEYIYSPFGGGWNLHYGPIEMEITNHGQDTVFNYLIHSSDISQCIWCYNGISTWQVDTLPIAPGGTEKIVLGSFVAECLQNVSGTICFSTFGPNGEADGNFLNDKSCGGYSIVTQTREPVVSQEYRLGPNPANQFVNIISDSSQKFKVRFFDVYGRKLLDRHVNSAFEEINIEQLPPGMYIVWVGENELINQSFRLNIIR